MSEVFEHQPVMVQEVVGLLAAVPPGVVVDATVGGGGHALAVLSTYPHLRLVGLDRDRDALAAAAGALAGHPSRVVLRQARFDQLAEVLDDLGEGRVSGVVLDLGVSSPQLDRPERGFSYHADGPLDMRMDRDQPTTAADVVNSYAPDRLARVLSTLGGERYASRIARAIVRARPLARTSELADVVRAAIPAPARRSGGHPARRTFQALRMEVNQEHEVLAPAVEGAIEACAPGGRVVVLSYHSGEDRVVKSLFRAAATGGCTCPPGLPCACGAVPTVRLVRRGAMRPSAAEVARNRRADSARLRVVEKLPDPDSQEVPPR